MFGQHRVGTGIELFEDGADAGVVGGGAVGDDDQEVATHEVGIAVRDVPTTDAIQQRLVVQVQQLHRVHPSSRARNRAMWSGPNIIRRLQASGPQLDRTVRRTCRLAVVATVDPISQRDTVFDRKAPAGLQQPGQTPARIDDTIGDDRSGRTCVDTASTCAAMIADRRRHRCGIGVEPRVGHHRAQHDPAPEPWSQQERVLAVPPDPTAPRGFTVDDVISVEDHDRPSASGAQRFGNPFEGCGELPVMVGRRVPRHLRRDLDRRVRGRIIGLEVAASPDDEGRCALHHARGIGAARWVLVGEGHVRVQAQVPAALELGSGVTPRRGAGRTDEIESRRSADLEEFGKVAAVEHHRLGSASAPGIAGAPDPATAPGPAADLGRRCV